MRVGPGLSSTAVDTPLTPGGLHFSDLYGVWEIIIKRGEYSAGGLIISYCVLLGG